MIHCFALAAAIYLSQLATPPTSSDVEFQLVWVQRDGEDNQNAKTDGKTNFKPRPCSNAFVWIKPVSVRELLKRKPDLAKPRLHRFSLRDGRVEPVVAIMHTKDSVWRLFDNLPKRAVSYQVIVNPANGTIPIGPARQMQFRKPELTPIAVRDDVGKAEPAHLLVMNHRWAGITDVNGKVTIADVKHDTPFRFRIACPVQRQGNRLRFECDTLEFPNPNSGSFRLQLHRHSLKRHVIRVMCERP